MRVLIFHGYLLRGTGSNVYNASLAAALVALGHEVHLLCQEPSPAELPFVDAVAEWDGGGLRVEALREPVRCTAYRPDIGGLLPVYVADRYEGVEARPFEELSDAEVERYVEANVAAVRDVAARAAPGVALANHLVMGPAILARAFEGTGTPYAVKIHGSALEYTVKRHPRFLPWAREGLVPARAVLVGSFHTAHSLWQTMEDPSVQQRTRLGPPGVDVHAFTPRDLDRARAGLAHLVERLEELAAQEVAGEGESSFAMDHAAAARALCAADPARDRLVAYTGKLIVSKGVDLLLAAWPLVLERVPSARLVVVGFGAYREGLERLRDALATGDLEAARRIAGAGRSLEDGPDSELRFLKAFLDGLSGDARERYLAAAAGLAERVVMTGRLEHAELADLLPAVEAQVVPSTFPESFGMVAVEAAACGALPVSAAHSGLAEVTRTLERAVPAEAAGLLSFPIGEGAVEALAARLVGWLEAPEELRERTRAALVAVARERYSWEGVARGVLAGAEGRLDELDVPVDPDA